mmetsp:Transcript_25801/g.47173  ORF Transcript_25801/g.47173 Transcript_25801/m.47173 type:complete len:349 (-) Transcript_25801:282-1328(-)
MLPVAVTSHHALSRNSQIPTAQVRVGAPEHSISLPTASQAISHQSNGLFCAAIAAVGMRVHSSQSQSKRKRNTSLRAVDINTSEKLPYVKLSNDKGDEATVHLFGGCVTSYKSDGQEWLAIRKDAKMDGSKPISGGLPHCFPQFGPGKIQQHGFARNLDWEVVQDESSSNKCVLQLTESETTEAMWPHKFECRYVVELMDDKLDTQLVVKNTDTEAWDFTTALHSYYNVSSIDSCEIVGEFEGKEKLDRMQDPEVTSKVDSNSVSITTAVDEVVKDVLPGKVVLKDDKGELEIVSRGGWRDVVFWSPYGDENMGYDKFVCVESAQIAGVQLKSGEEWDAGMALVPKSA